MLLLLIKLLPEKYSSGSPNGSEDVALPELAIGQALSLNHSGESSVVRNSSLNRLLNDSA